MRITIDATSALLRSAGVKSYTYHWIRNLQCAAVEDEIRAFPKIAEFKRLNHEGSILSIGRTLPRIALLHAINLLGSGLLDQVIAGSDVFHASNQVWRAPRRAKLTATVHDMTCFLMPDLHTAGNVHADRNFAKRILSRADGLIAVSENTRQDAIRLLRISPDRIQTIYSGVADEYFDAQPVLRKRPYVLYLGTIEPRKNLDTLLDAWGMLKPGLRQEFELVVVGPAGWRSEKTISRLRSESTYLGYVPEADVPGLMAGATLFLYPSLYEGFGFPVVQAMAARTAVITSNSSCLPEIAGDGAMLVDPRSTAEIAAALTRLLESNSARECIAKAGRSRAEGYRWRTCAEKSLTFFHRIGSGTFAAGT